MLIEAVYRRWNREKLADVADLMSKYEGQEADIYDKIIRKYVFCLEERYWKPLIVAMYRRFSPAKLPGIEPILAKYRTSEAALYRALCDKYIPTVVSFELQHQVEAMDGTAGLAPDDGSGDNACMAEPVSCGEHEDAPGASPRTPLDEVLVTAVQTPARDHAREELPQGRRRTLQCDEGDAARPSSDEPSQNGRCVPARSQSHSPCSRRRSLLHGASPAQWPGQRHAPCGSSLPRPPSPPPRRLSRRSPPRRASPQRLTPPRQRQPSLRRWSPSRRRRSGMRSAPGQGSPVSERGLLCDSLPPDERRGSKRPQYETFVSQAKSRRREREAQASREDLTRVEAARKVEALLDDMSLPTQNRREIASPEAIGDQEDEASIRDAVDAAFGDILPDSAGQVLTRETIAADESAEHLDTADDLVAANELVRAAEQKAQCRENGAGTVRRKKRKKKLEAMQHEEPSTTTMASGSQDAVASPFDVSAPQASPTDEMVSDAITAAAAQAGVLTGYVRVRRRRKKVIAGEDAEVSGSAGASKLKKRKKDKARPCLTDPAAELCVEERDPRNREAGLQEAGEQAPASPAAGSRREETREETREMLLQKMQELKRTTRAADGPQKAPATRPKAGFPPVPRGREVPFASCRAPSDEEESASPLPAAPPAPTRVRLEPGVCVFTEPPPGVWDAAIAPRAAPRPAPAAGSPAASELDRRQVLLRGAREAELRNKALNLLDRLRPVSKAFG